MSDPVITATPVATPSEAAPAALPVAAAPARKVVATPGRAAFVRPAASVAAPVAAEPVAAPIVTEPAKPARSNIPVRIANRMAHLEETAKQVDVYRALMAPRAKEDLAALPETQRKSIIKKVGDDPAAQIAYLNELREGGFITPAANTTARPAPATTSENPQNGPAAGALADEDVAAFKRHADLKARWPQEAAAFFLGNREAIKRGAEKSQTRN